MFPSFVYFIDLTAILELHLSRMQSKSFCFDLVCWTCLWSKLDPQTIWLILVIVFSTLSKHPSVYTLLVFLIWPETVDFWAFCDPETKRNESFSLQRRHCEGSLHFNAGPEGATCAECQTDSVGPALNQCGLVQLGFFVLFCPVLISVFAAFNQV